MNPTRSALLIIAAVAAWAGQAWALDVYLNGVLITGVRNQDFENATVSLDDEGNVRISAPQYRVEREDQTDRGPGGRETTTTTSPEATTPAPQISPQRPSSSSQPTASPESPPEDGGEGLSRRYWMVVQVNGAGMVEYRFDVHINGRLVRSFTDADAPSAPIDVTDFIRPGQNNVRVVADKITEGTRRSESSRHWVRIVVADGHIEGSAVVIDRPGVIFARNAAQTERVSREFTLRGE